jgi:hypothetical protein
MATSGPQVVVGGAFLVAGVLCLVGAYGRVRFERDRRSRGVVVPGRVVGSTPARFGSGTYFCPVVEFAGPTGTRTFTQPSGTSWRPEVGREVRVWFDPARPEDDPVIHRDRVQALFVPVLLVLGLGALTGGVLLLTGGPR